MGRRWQFSVECRRLPLRIWPKLEDQGNPKFRRPGQKSWTRSYEKSKRLLPIMVRSSLSRGRGSFFITSESLPAHAGDKPGTDHDEGIRIFRGRFEAIISTEKEESGSSGQYPQRKSVSCPLPHAPSPAHVAGGRPGTVPAQSRPGVMSEKQMMQRNEKAIGGIV